MGNSKKAIKLCKKEKKKEDLHKQESRTSVSVVKFNTIIKVEVI